LILNANPAPRTSSAGTQCRNKLTLPPGQRILRPRIPALSSDDPHIRYGNAGSKFATSITLAQWLSKTKLTG
jgi:hypothetical protein